MTRPCTSWPERYYEETDPEKRRLLLEQAMTAGEGDAAENEVRHRLWELRYTRPRRNAPLADRYIALWLALDHWRKSGLAPRQVRAAQKELEELAGLLRPEGGADLVPPLVHSELVHAVRLYLSTCLQSNYGTMLMGLMRMSDEQLVGKAAKEVAEVTCLVPRWAGMDETFAPLAPAAQEAFALVFPGKDEVLEQALVRCGQAGE